MKYILLAMTVICKLSGQTTSGIISSDETWFPGDTIIVTGDITVSDNAVLTVKPGTVISGTAGGAEIKVSGTSCIRAIGKQDSMVSFSRIQVTFEGITGDSMNVIRYSRFEHGTGNALIYFFNPADTMTTPTIIIENCIFKSSNWAAVYILRGCSPVFRNCLFDGAATGMFIHGGKNIDISYSTFTNNSCGIFNASLQGVYMPWEPGIININHCTFYTITGERGTVVTQANGYGIFTSQMPGSLTVSNSIFHTIDHSGIRDFNADDPNFPVNWRIDNNYNCFYNCTDSSCRGLDAGPNSMVGDPLFIDGVHGDFSLGAGSPCLGAGSDGEHIGAWQGVVGIRGGGYLTKGTSIPDNSQGIMFDLRGRVHQRNQGSTGMYFTVDEGTHIIAKHLIIK